MAVVTGKSKAITNRDASPKVVSDGAFAKGALKQFVGFTAIANGDSIASKFILGSIPSNAIVTSLLMSCPAMAVGGAGDIGLYKKTDEAGVAGVVVDADFFAAAQVLTAALAGIEVGNKNVLTLALSETKIWQLLGLPSDPNLIYDVVMTLTTAAGGAGSIQLKCQYTE